MGYFFQPLRTKEIVMRQVGKILAVVLFASTSWISGAKAEPVWFKTCEVSVAGLVSPDAVVMRISDLSDTPAFTNTWFLAVTPIASEMLAVALTAISLGNQVMCLGDLALTPPELIRMHLTDLSLP